MDFNKPNKGQYVTKVINFFHENKVNTMNVATSIFT